MTAMREGQLSNLAIRPQARAAVEEIIEEAFKYQAPYKFREDFYPLLAPGNAAHNHLILQGDTVIGHLGVRLVNLVWATCKIPVALVGGLAIQKAWRGQGLFKAAFNQVLQLYEKQVGLFILWSDQAALYAKFNFWQAGLVLQLGEKTNLIPALIRAGWRKYTPYDFRDPLGQQLPALYQRYAKNFLAVERTAADWQTLAGIKSATYLVHPTSASLIDAYVVIGKGFDLGGVVHEVGGDEAGLAEFLSHWQNYKIWLPGTKKWQQQFPLAKPLYTGLFRRGNEAWLKPLWAKLDQETQQSITQLYQAGEDHLLWPKLFGPGENPLLPPLFISGLDSI